MNKKRPDFLMVVLLIFGLGVLSTGFANVAQSFTEQPVPLTQAFTPQSQNSPQQAP